MVVQGPVCLDSAVAHFPIIFYKNSICVSLRDLAQLPQTEGHEHVCLSPPRRPQGTARVQAGGETSSGPVEHQLGTTPVSIPHGVHPGQVSAEAPGGKTMESCVGSDVCYKMCGPHSTDT